jgi:hypothetical protein
MVSLSGDKVGSALRLRVSLLPAVRCLQASDSDGASRFSRVKFLCWPLAQTQQSPYQRTRSAFLFDPGSEVFDSAGPVMNFAFTLITVLPSVLRDAVGALISRFRSSQLRDTQPAYTPV